MNKVVLKDDVVGHGLLPLSSSLSLTDSAPGSISGTVAQPFNISLDSNSGEPIGVLQGFASFK